MGIFRRSRRRDGLRHCPVCTADAVGVVDRQVLDATRTALCLRCGGCGTFRRVVASPAMVELFDQRLERECQYMRELASLGRR
jgi:hypothetical protein